MQFIPNRIAISIIGLPGAGKTTLAQNLVDKYKFFSLQGGYLLRKTMHFGNSIEEKKYAKHFVSTGRLAPACFLFRLFDKEIKGRYISRLVFDGFPRNYDHYNKFLKYAHDNSLRNESISFIHLDVSSDQIKDRLSNRLTCRYCNHNSNTLRCSICNSECIKREDDLDPKIIDRRIRVFDTITLPLINRIESEHNYLKIEKDLTIEQVLSKVVTFIDI